MEESAASGGARVEGTPIGSSVGPSIGQTEVAPGISNLENTVGELRAKVAQEAKADVGGIGKPPEIIPRPGQGVQAVERGTPAEGMDLDPRHKAIQEELRQKWLQEHPSQDFLTVEGQNYNLGYMDPKQQGPTLKSDTDKLFNERYPDDTKGYEEKEKTRIYKDSSEDPAITRVEKDILRATNLDSEVRSANNAAGIDSYGNVWDRVNVREGIHAWDNFVEQYPDKAKAYSDKGHPEIKRALERRERQTQTEEQQGVSGEESKDSQPNNEEINQRFKGLEQQIKNLTSENAELKTNLTHLTSAMREMLPAMDALLKDAQAKETDSKKKETLAQLILKIAGIMTLSLFLEGGKTVTDQQQ